MSTIPTNLARIPTMLSSRIMSDSLSRASTSILNAQIQLATGRLINRPSDGPIAASTIGVLDDILERREQRLRNLTHAESVLNNIDQALGDATEIVLEAKGIGLSQIGVGSDQQTRENQAQIIDAMLMEMFNISNRKFQDLHYFGGSQTAGMPYERLLNGIAYRGNLDSFQTDLGMLSPVSLTVAGQHAFGAVSARVEGDVDLNPRMTEAMRLVDLNGARGLDVQRGSIRVDVNGSVFTVDLSKAETVGDVLTTIEDAINAEAPGALAAGGVRIDPASGHRIELDLNPGFTVTFSDFEAGNTAADLGLSNLTFESGINTLGEDVDPRLTDLTPISAFTGVTVPLGTIRITNAGQVRDLDLSGVTTIGGLKNAVAGLKIGVRVEISEAGDRLNFINELSGGRMSIAEVAGGTTATELGVRSFNGSTRLEDFNGGLGVEIRAGSVDPISGTADPAADRDFQIRLKDGSSFDVDLVGAETVQDVLDAMNAAAAGAGLTVPGDFFASLAPDGNGIHLSDGTAGAPGATTSVGRLNGSLAAEHLGIEGSFTSATLTGEDRATIAVDSVFSRLIALRDALRANDERGIGLATEGLDDDLNRLARARAEVGVRTQQVLRHTIREEDMKLQDVSLKSQVQDLDFTEAAVRFANLQQQFQAGLQVTSLVNSISLLDFLR